MIKIRPSIRKRYIAALLRRIDPLPFEATVRVAIAKDGGGEQIELHVYDVPRAQRRAVEDDMLEILVDLDREIEPTGSLAFVHSTDFEPHWREEVELGTIARHAAVTPGHPRRRRA